MDNIEIVLQAGLRFPDTRDGRRARVEWSAGRARRARRCPSSQLAQPRRRLQDARDQSRTDTLMGRQ